MKKFLAILLCAVMVLAVVACNNNGGTETPDPTPATEAEYKLGMGVVVNMDSSAAGNAQVDATVAAVVLDAEGKIVACRIDVAQNKFAVANFATEATKTFETKMELGDRYGMAGKVDNDGNGVKLEWYEQTKAFEAYVVGMTAAQVEAIELQEANGHQIAVDQALLDAGCSMQITDFIAAVAAACKDEQGMSFKTASTFTLGVSADTVANESVAPTAEANGTVKMYTDFGAAVVADGKIIAALNDAIQPNITVAADGAIVEKSFTATKRNLKEDYGMAGKVDGNGDGVKLEWYVQSEAFSKHVVGMTGEQVANMETAANMIGYQMTTDTALLEAGCTIQITAIKAVVAEAVTNAR